MSVEVGANRSAHAPTAVFDLDGTLTTKDSFVAFLLTFGVRFSRYAGLATMPVWITVYLARMMKDYELKQRLIADFIAGFDPSAIEEHTAWFCENWLPRHLHPVGHALLQGHLRKGHRVILLSASPDIFVPQIAQTFGINEVICTRVKRIDGVWQGELDGPNCKGEEKLNAIRRWLGVHDAPPETYSYGDSKSDLPVLSWAQKGAWVRRNDFQPLPGTPRSDFPGTMGR